MWPLISVWCCQSPCGRKKPSSIRKTGNLPNTLCLIPPAGQNSWGYRCPFRQALILLFKTTRPSKWPKSNRIFFGLCKLGVEAQRQGKGIEFAARVSRVILGGTKDWDKGDHLKNAAAAAGLDLDLMDRAIADGDHLAEIEQNQKDLDASGHWGVPTMVVRGEPFFGQDRIETLRWRLDKYGLRKPSSN